MEPSHNPGASTRARLPLRFTSRFLAASCVILFAPALWAGEAEDQYAVAAGLYARQQWKLAAEEFQALLKKYPDHQDASRSVFFLAETLVQLDRLDEARARFREYLEREPAGQYARAALFRAAEAAYLAGNLADAKPDLQQFLKTYPDDALDAYVLAYLGDIALEKKDFAAAAEHFEQCLAHFPEGKLQDNCRFGLARSFEQQGKPEQAEVLYRALAAKSESPLADDAQFQWGALQYAAGKHAEAIETFSAFQDRLKDSPWRASAELGHGWALVKLGRFDEARARFSGIAADEKVGVEARYWTGLAEKAQKQWKEAAKTLLALAAEPSDDAHRKWMPAILFHAGDALLRAGDAAEARNQFDRVLAVADAQNEWRDDAARGKIQAALSAKDYATVARLAAEFDRQCPNSPLSGEVRRMGIEGRLAHASRLLEDQKFAEAVSPLEAVLAAKPDEDTSVRAKTQLAVSCARSGQLEQAKAIHAELMKEHPTHKLVRPMVEQLGEAALAAGDAGWSAELFRWLGSESEAPNEELRSLLGLGWSQYKTGNLEQAAATLAELLKKDPDVETGGEAALLRGRILQQQEQCDPALAMFDLVIEKYSKSRHLVGALLAAARLRDQLQRDREAAQLYERLAAAFPTFPARDGVLYEWAWTLNDLGDAERFSDIMVRLHQEYPNSRFWPDATYRLAQRAAEAKDDDRAVRLIEELLAKAPKAAACEHALALRWQIAAAQKDWKAVQTAAQRLLADFPASRLRLLAEFWAAEAIFRQGDGELARKKYDSLAEKAQGCQEPWVAMISLRRAQLLGREEKWRDALALASGIQKAYPGFEQQYEADYLIGRCLAARADFEGARQAYLKVIRAPQGGKTETTAMAQWMIGETYYHQKNYAAAIREFLRVEILYAYPTWQSAALLEAAKCHEALEQWKEATELYTRLVTHYPDTPCAEEASRRLQSADQRQRTLAR